MPPATIGQPYPTPQRPHRPRRTGRRAATAVAVLVALALLTTGCFSDADAADDQPKPGTPLPLVAEPADADTAPRAPTQVRIGEDVHGKTTKVFAAGATTVLTEEGDGELATRTDMPALVTALDDDGNITARGIALALDGFDAGTAQVDYTSTAFTRLVTTPPFTTSNPLELIVLRHVADESPHLAELATALEAEAARNPAYDATTTPQQARALAALSEDVTARLDAMAANPPSETSGTANRVAPAWALAPQARKASKGGGGSSSWEDCLPAVGAAQTRLCLEMNEDLRGNPKWKKNGTVEIEATNKGAGYALVAAARPGKGSEPLGLVPPQMVGLPTLTEIATALGKGTSKTVMGVQVRRFCGIVKMFSSECHKGLTESTDPEKAIRDLVADLAPTSHGSATLTMTKAEGKLPLVTITMGYEAGIATLPTGGRLDPAWLREQKVSMSFLTVFVQVIKPLVELVAGYRAKGPKHRGDGSVPVEGIKTFLGQINDKVYATAKTNVQYAEAINTLLAVQRSNKPPRRDLLESIGVLALDFVTDPEWLSVFLPTDDMSKYMRETIAKSIRAWGSSVVPGPGWVKNVDRGIGVGNIGIAFANLGREMARTQSVAFHAAAAPAALDVLKGTDWKNRDDYLVPNTPAVRPDGTLRGPAWKPVPLTDGIGATPEFNRLRFVTAVTGTMGKQQVPSTLVVLAERPHSGDMGEVLNYFLFRVGDGKPYLHALGGEDPWMRFVQASWRFTDDGLLRLGEDLPGSSGLPPAILAAPLKPREVYTGDWPRGVLILDGYDVDSAEQNETLWEGPKPSWMWSNADGR